MPDSPEHFFFFFFFITRSQTRISGLYCLHSSDKTFSGQVTLLFPVPYEPDDESPDDLSGTGVL